MDRRQDFHVHCNYNDHSASNLTIRNVIIEAEKKGLHTLAFTEHVRRTSEWIPEYLREIEVVRSGEKCNVNVIPGFEAKILRDGSVDCPDKYSTGYFVVASFHTHYAEKEVWTNALKRTIENPAVDVIGHLAPEPSFHLEPYEVKDLADLIAGNHKTVEINAKYHRPLPDWITIFKQSGVNFVLGSDAHALEEIGNYGVISDLITLAE